MSAIFGIFHRDGKPVSAEALDRQKQTLNHWNADAQGVWREGNVGLGHLMLFYTPESLNEPLPLHDSLANLTITADARIDNRDEIFAALGVPPAHQTGMPDSTLILLSYKKWGADCPRHLIGDFAFVIWDRVNQTMFCARDHMGVRPFYYFLSDNTFAFARQIRGLLCLDEVSTTWNDGYIREIIVADYPKNKKNTLFSAVSKLPAAHTMTVTRDSVSFSRYHYWDPDYELKLPSDEEYVEQMRFHLRQAVTARMRTVYPVGAQLSGGLDSSGICAFAAEYAQEKNIALSTYSNVLREEWLGKKPPYTDDRHLIKEVLQFLEIHDWTHLDDIPLGIIETVREVTKRNDGLSIVWTPFMIMEACRQGKKHEIRGLLSGFPGDEAASAFGSNVAFELFKTGRWPACWEQLGYEIAVRKHSYSRLRTIVTYLARIVIPSVHQRVSRLRHGKRVSYKYRGILSERLQKEERKAIEKGNSLDNLQTFTRNRSILELEDSWNSFRIESEANVSLADRVNVLFPMADVRLIEFCLSVPGIQFRRNGTDRWLYRRAIAEMLPASVVNFEKRHGSHMIPSLTQRLREQSPEILSFFSSNLSSVSKSLERNRQKTECFEAFYHDNVNPDCDNLDEHLIAFISLIFSQDNFHHANKEHTNKWVEKYST